MGVLIDGIAIVVNIYNGFCFVVLIIDSVCTYNPTVMTTIIKLMGVQQWRLRPPPAELELGIDELVTAPHAALTEQAVVSDDGLVSANYSAQSAQLRAGTETLATDPNDSLATDSAIFARTNDRPSINPLSPSVPIPPVNTSADPALARLPLPMPAVAAMPSLARAPVINATESGNATNPMPTAAAKISESIGELDWQGLQALIDGQSHCQSCGPSNSSLGSGDANADWLFVTDAPVSSDLESQQLFSGRAGQLFEAMLLAVGLTRGTVYTTSVFKCATSDDLSAIPNCDKLLDRQIELIEPKILVVFGEFAAQSVARSNEALEMMRSKDLQCYRTKIPIVVTYSPQRLLDQPALKAGAWLDLKKCLAITR
jgi:uracil-DNA glycosylase family 4